MKSILANLKFIVLIIASISLINCSDKSNDGSNDDSNDPQLSIGSSVMNFGETQVGSHSAPSIVTITSSNLTSATSIETTNSDFEISIDGSNYTTLLTVPFSDLNDQTRSLYVRLSPSVNSLGTISGELLISNAESNTNISRDLTGTGIPITHNYQAFSNQALGFGGGFNQSAQQMFTLHNDLSNIETINMYLEIDCPSTGCDDWDRFANVKVKDPATGNWYEIGRYITPYWVGTELLPRGLQFDVTDFKSLLTGNVELRIYIENWTQKTDLVSVEFDFVEGTPDYPFYNVAEILPYHNNSIAGVPYGVNHNFDLDKSVTIPANAEEIALRTIISGWGHATPNDTDGRGCAEWCFRTHNIKINGSSNYSHDLSPIGCASNPISNQSPGNWMPDRAGWCPGMAVPVRSNTMPNSMAGSTFSFEYEFENWTNNSGNGDAYYATSTYVIVKSNTAINSPTVN